MYVVLFLHVHVHVCGIISIYTITGNQITELTGLSNLTSLTSLSVSDNRLETIKGLDGLSLNNLNLVSFKIKSYMQYISYDIAINVYEYYYTKEYACTVCVL